VVSKENFLNIPENKKLLKKLDKERAPAGALTGDDRPSSQVVIVGADYCAPDAF